MRSSLQIALIAILAIGRLTSCSIFDTRTPEAPDVDGSQFIQPDTPEQVISNLEQAVEQKSAQNYRRSLSPDFSFTPTATAFARSSIWLSWGSTEEEQYFTTMLAATPEAAISGLELNDRTFSVVDETTSRLDATYILRVGHNRQDAPSEVQGRLVWEFEKREDGLWYLGGWIDQEISGQTSWSDLKEAFAS